MMRLAALQKNRYQGLNKFEAKMTEFLIGSPIGLIIIGIAGAILYDIGKNVYFTFKGRDEAAIINREIGEIADIILCYKQNMHVFRLVRYSVGVIILEITLIGMLITYQFDSRDRTFSLDFEGLTSFIHSQAVIELLASLGLMGLTVYSLRIVVAFMRILDGSGYTLKRIKVLKHRANMKITNSEARDVVLSKLDGLEKVYNGMFKIREPAKTDAR